MKKEKPCLTAGEVHKLIGSAQRKGGAPDPLEIAMAVQKMMLSKIKKSATPQAATLLLEEKEPKQPKQHPPTQAVDLISRADFKDLKRFQSCKFFRIVNDVPISRMEDLADLGLVRKIRGHYFVITKIGQAILDDEERFLGKKEKKRRGRPVGSRVNSASTPMDEDLHVSFPLSLISAPDGVLIAVRQSKADPLVIES